MTIGIDISMLMYAGSGVASYTENLVKTLIGDHPEHRYKLFYSSFRKPPAFENFKKEFGRRSKIITYHMPPRFFNLLWNKYDVLSVNKLIGDVDVFHSSDYLRPPLTKKTKGITTIHDLTWKKFPQFHTQDIVDLHTRKMEKTIRYGDTILVDSKNTKKDLLHYFPSCNRNKIHTVYLGVGDRFRVIGDTKKIKGILEKYNIPFPQKFLLYVGAIEPRKNLDTAIRMFHQLIQEEQYQDYTFFLIGRAGWKNQHIFQLITDLHVEDRVKFLGYVENEDLPYFYNAAAAHIYLSLYEGFGLPPLEAAQCGTPSLVYKKSSLIETFPITYPFASRGRELLTLKKLLVKKPDLTFVYAFTWKRYVDEYIKIISSAI